MLPFMPCQHVPRNVTASRCAYYPVCTVVNVFTVYCARVQAAQGATKDRVLTGTKQ